jgi:hypothetical protein
MWTPTCTLPGPIIKTIVPDPPGFGMVRTHDTSPVKRAGGSSPCTPIRAPAGDQAKGISIRCPVSAASGSSSGVLLEVWNVMLSNRRPVLIDNLGLVCNVGIIGRHGEIVLAR